MRTVEQIEAQLAHVRKALIAAGDAASTARVKADNATPGGLSSHDPGILSGISRKPNRKADNRRWAAYSKYAEAQINLDRLRNDVRILELKLADTIKERDRVRFTREQLLAARLVKTNSGWAKVRRVNVKTVSIDSGYSWAELVPFEKILDFRDALT